LPPEYRIYCDGADDEELARIVFRSGPLAAGQILRLPPRATAPAFLLKFLWWERADWLITRDDRLVAAAELSRHGYTGDNGFQRFARLQRAVSLGIPSVYFTPFSRTRLNENQSGMNHPRNVAPEMFAAMILAGQEHDIPCLALRWPTDLAGIPIPLSEPGAAAALDRLRAMMEGFATAPDSETLWEVIPSAVEKEMRAQAELPFRGSSTRLVIDLPIDVEDDGWLWKLLPPSYFAMGKADKILAYAAMGSTKRRALPHGYAPGFWSESGQAQVLYLGYQQRPDPACGLIAFAGVLARRDNRNLIVVWPRLFMSDGPQRQALLAALLAFKQRGDGRIADEGHGLGFSPASLSAFRERINVGSAQFGLFTKGSKVDRVLGENADLCVFGDEIYLPRIPT
jgi:hypothetical protein